MYDRAEGELLILGKPGAGKTTLLVELTATLLERAERDEQFPMPVVFHHVGDPEWRLDCEHLIRVANMRLYSYK